MKEEIIQAVAELGAIPGFPQDEDARAAVMRSLGSFIADPKALRFVVDRAIGTMRRWEGVAGLREIHCEYHDRLQTQRQIEEFERWKREAAALPEAERQANRELADSAQHAARRGRESGVR
jgi:hypothetical protein